MSNISSETLHKTFHISGNVTGNSYTINDVETPTGTLRGFVLTKTGAWGFVNMAIYFAFAFPDVDSFGNFRYVQYYYTSGTGNVISVNDTSGISEQGYVYDASAKTLTLNVFADSVFSYGDYELLIW